MKIDYYTGINTCDLAALLKPEGSTAGSYGSLLQMLAIFEQAGVDPSLQIEPHFSPDGSLGLTEFLAAPFDRQPDDPAEKPWVALRHAQGRTVPWMWRGPRHGRTTPPSPPTMAAGTRARDRRGTLR